MPCPHPELQITGGRYEKGDVKWVKTPLGRCMSKFETGSMEHFVMLKIYTLFEDHIPQMMKVTQKIVSSQSTWIWVQQVIPLACRKIPTYPVRAPLRRRKFKRSLFGGAPETKDHTRNVSGECCRCNGQEFESDNKDSNYLPYYSHKRVRLWCVEL